MATDSRLLTPAARRAANRLLDELQRARTVHAGGPSVPGPGEIDTRPALIEHATGALMLHFGIDSHRALEVLIGWARTSRTPVSTVAHTLLSGICEGNPQTEDRQRPLMRWLEAQLGDGVRPPRAGI